MSSIQTLEEKKAIVRRFYEEVHGGNHDLLQELVAEPCSLHGFSGDSIVTLDDAKRGMENQKATFANWKISVGDQIAEDDTVVSPVTITGVHVGDFKGIAPTNKKVEFTGVFMDRVVDGKIVEMWHRPDYLTLVQQIGGFPFQQTEKA